MIDIVEELTAPSIPPSIPQPPTPSAKILELLELYQGVGSEELAGALLEAVGGGASALAASPISCPGCRGVLQSPVTGACGHTCCRACCSQLCPRCRRPLPLPPSSLRDNVLVKAAVEKWWPSRRLTGRSLESARAALKADRPEAALLALDSALRNHPGDHLLLEARSETLGRLHRWETSLQDAQHVTKLKPLWPKGYYRKGIALGSLGYHEDALLAFSLSVSLDKYFIPIVKHEVIKTLQKLLSPTKPCKGSALSLRNPLSPWWPLNYINENTHKNEEGILQSFDGMTTPNYPKLGYRKLYNLLDRISQEIEKLKRMDIEPGEPEIRPELVDQSDFDCVLCCRTLWRPVTTPCGHTYCSMCLERCLDYSANCPLCMTPLNEYLATSEKSVTEFIESALLMALPREYASRLMAHRQEVTSLIHAPDIPVFVCTTAFPTVSCPLFVFEPRYRLMVRQVIESGNRLFGIAACLKQLNGVKRFADYGTILEIKDWILMNDGCSILTNVGVRRFRVVSRGERDGYDTARVQYIVDIPIQQSSLIEITMLHDQVLERGREWFGKISSEIRAEILRTFGDMPLPEANWTLLEDGPAWTWWLLAILPLGPHLKVGILGTTCLEKRLRAIDKTLDHLEKGPSFVQAIRGSHHAILKRSQTAIRLT